MGKSTNVYNTHYTYYTVFCIKIISTNVFELLLINVKINQPFFNDLVINFF